MTNGADVVNASWGSRRPSLLVEDAVAYAHASGVVFVAAAGNAGMDVIDFTPAWVTDAVTVAASDHQDRRAAFSNWGLGVDVTAPGTGVLSLRAQGTDMVRRRHPRGRRPVLLGERHVHGLPHVAGAAALLIARISRPFDRHRPATGWPSARTTSEPRTPIAPDSSAAGA